MDFRYFYNQTLLEDSDLRAFVPYNATGSGQSGNFMANTPDTGTSTGVFFTLANTANLSDFTAIVTYNRQNVQRSTKLMSNFASGTGGWTLGIDHSNFLFIHAEYPFPCAYTFDQITLGAKSCIALQKQGQSFSVYNFSPYSERIEEIQTVTFEPNSLLSGSNIKMGSDGYRNQKYLSGVPYFRGTMDQYAVIDNAVDEKTLLTLFSGFSPYSVTTGTSTGNYLVSSSFVFPTGSPPQADLQFMSGVASGYFNSVVQSLSPIPGIYEGQFDIQLNDPNNYGIDTYIGNDSFCSTIFQQFGPSYNLGYSGLSFNGTGDVNFSLNEQGQYSFQFLFSPARDVVLNQVYQTNVVTTGYSLSLDSGYYSGFYLYGVAETSGPTTLLASVDNRTGLVGSEGIFDAVSGYFKLPGIKSGQKIWFDGAMISGSGYSSNNSYIDVPNYTETSDDYVIYDSPDGNIIFQHFSVSEYATGVFHLGRSVVFTGYNSFSPMIRIKESSYLETHPLHLYHAKNVIDPTGLSLYNNNDQYWNFPLLVELGGSLFPGATLSAFVTN